MKRLAVVAAALFAAGVAVTGLAGTPAVAVGSNVKADVTTPAFTQTETVTRSYVSSSGATTNKVTNKVTLSVSQTTDLQGRQEIEASWSGAHPTGGIVADQNAAGAEYEEYPVVLLECRGVGSSSAPVTQQVSPETCWTQSWTERYQRSNATQAGGLYPAYRLDTYGTHGAVVGGPSPLPTTPPSCQRSASATPVQYWVPWVAASGKVYDGGTGGFCGQPPQANGGIASALPSNETFGVTGTNGTGSAEFDVFTTAENTTLGCSDTVACSLVAVPIMGISCDGDLFGPSPTAAELTDLADCEETGAYAPGSNATAGQYEDGAELAVTGSLWWSPSNWRNRITVPLTFAPLANACSIVNGKPVIDVYGSTLMLQATDQWEPSFCAGDNDKFSFVQVAAPEPEARDLVATGGADAAFTSYAQTGGYGRPVVNAPVAITGFTISYAISGSNGEPVTTLKLTPLLLAKLLTESYLATAGYGDPALKKNPLNITDDPEFTALNPDVAPNPYGFGPAFAESELISLSSDSDVMEALTTYINDTPAARAFLNGTPDTSMPGEDMVVNPAYKGISLPVDQWPLLSTYESTGFDNGSAAACLANSPEPFYSLIAAPLANLEDISEAMQFEKPNSTVTCASNAEQTVNSMVAGSRQEAGSYFMLGITPLADDQRYNLQAAELQTTSGTFVAPSNTSLEAAGLLLKPDTATGTWPIPYGTFETSAGASAYPGTMVVYAAVPTSGLSATDAADYASMLKFAVSTGQTPGSGVGQLPPGYLPLTQGDGLGALVNYTLASAADVAAQNGKVPPVTPSGSSGATTTPTPTTTTTPTSSTTTSQSSVTPTQRSTPSPTASRYTNPGRSNVTTQPGRTSASAAAAEKQKSRAKPPIARWLGHTLDVALWTGGFWKGGLFVVLILILALLGVLGVPATYLWGRKRGRW